MVAESDIVDRETLQSWLEGRSREDAICIAQRAAMRVAPSQWVTLDFPSVHGLALNSLGTLWPLLTAAVAREFTAVEFKKAVRAAHDASFEVAHASAPTAAASAATMAARAVFDEAAYSAAYGAAYAADVLYVSGAAWSSVRWDCAQLEQGQDPNLTPLWTNPKPSDLLTRWVEVRANWVRAGGPVWAFWIGWYENALEGRPQDWPLLRDIALIPAEDWQGGPDRVHPIIEKILLERERLKLLDQVSALIAELSEARRIITQPVASAAARSHNMPPELIDVESEAQRAITIIWADLEEAKTELERPHPQPSVLRRIGHKLVGAVAAFAEYGAMLGDIALQKAAEEIGSTGTKWALRILVFYFAAPSGTVQSIGTGLIELAKMLGSP